MQPELVLNAKVPINHEERKQRERPQHKRSDTGSSGCSFPTTSVKKPEQI